MSASSSSSSSNINNSPATAPTDARTAAANNNRTTRLAELLRLQMELYTVGLIRQSLIIQIADLETELGIEAARQDRI